MLLWISGLVQNDPTNFFFFFLASCPRWRWKPICLSKVLPQLLTTIEILLQLATPFSCSSRERYGDVTSNIGYALSLSTGCYFGNSTSFLRKDNSITAHPCEWRFLAALAIMLYLLIFFWPQDNRKPLWTCFSKERCMCPAGTFGDCGWTKLSGLIKVCWSTWATETLNSTYPLVR